MDSGEKRFTVGEIAKLTGLTVRTLQHYDNIGILPVSGRTEAGRRYYSKDDILRLEQIVFYKSLGISLHEIKEKLIDSPTPQMLEEMLSTHLKILLKKISSLHTAMSTIDVSLNVVRSGYSLPWETLTHLIRTMEGSSLDDWTRYEFGSKLYENMVSKNITLTDALGIYHSVRSLMVEAATLSNVGLAPGHQLAQSLAKRWWAFIMKMTNGEESAVSALAAVNENRHSWPEEDRTLFQSAEPFIEKALEIYIKENNINVPDSLV